jgi:hypothetical protein
MEEGYQPSFPCEIKMTEGGEWTILLYMDSIDLSPDSWNILWRGDVLELEINGLNYLFHLQPRAYYLLYRVEVWPRGSQTDMIMVAYRLPDGGVRLVQNGR